MTSAAGESISAVCSICKETYPSKRKLFQHLEQAHDYVSENAKPVKVACLVGWLSQEGTDVETFLKDPRVVNTDPSTLPLDADGYALTEDEVSGNGTTKARVETLLFNAIKDACDTGMPISGQERMKSEARAANQDANNSAPQIQLRSRSDLLKGHSRGSQEVESTLSLGLERTCHALADTVAIVLQRPPGNEAAWLEKVNAKLPVDMRVLSCKVLPGKGSDFNAHATCTQRRFEYMIPLDLLIPETEEEYASAAHGMVDGRAVKSKKDQNWRQEGPRSALDEHFPDDTEEGARRVCFFRILKMMFKSFGGKYQMFHNFASGGACPEDPCSQRTVDRIFHKSMTKCEDGTAWAVFSISGDNFLRGQIRRIFGTAIAVARGWLPQEFVDFAVRSSTVYRDDMQMKERVKQREEKIELERKQREELEAKALVRGVSVEELEEGENKGRKGKGKKGGKPKSVGAGKKEGGPDKDDKEEILFKEKDWKDTKAHTSALNLQCEPLCLAPSVPAPGLYLAECKYGNWEAKYDNTNGFVLDPRRARQDAANESEAAGVQRLAEWETVVQRHIMHGAHMKATCTDWVDKTKTYCAALWRRVQYDMVHITRTDTQLRETALGLYPSLCAEGATTANATSVQSAPAVYRRVLQLLQEADRSGAWPSSSFARQRLLEESSQPDSLPAPSAGGTFTLGAFPEGTLQPKGNPVFPDLLLAIFELERAILPCRAPSTTVAINKHAQFKIHRDSGAGSGQSTSAIVALGDFSGGELGLDWVGLHEEEKSVVDIRYAPAEFCGWTSRHFTLPFAGERYSLVWFTPQGCGEKDMFWWENKTEDETGEEKDSKRPRK